MSFGVLRKYDEWSDVLDHLRARLDRGEREYRESVSAINRELGVPDDGSEYDRPACVQASCVAEDRLMVVARSGHLTRIQLVRLAGVSRALRYFIVEYAGHVWPDILVDLIVSTPRFVPVVAHVGNYRYEVNLYFAKVAHLNGRALHFERPVNPLCWRLRDRLTKRMEALRMDTVYTTNASMMDTSVSFASPYGGSMPAKKYPAGGWPATVSLQHALGRDWVQAAPNYKIRCACGSDSHSDHSPGVEKAEEVGRIERAEMVEEEGDAEEEDVASEGSNCSEDSDEEGEGEGEGEEEEME